MLVLFPADCFQVILRYFFTVGVGVVIRFGVCLRQKWFVYRCQNVDIREDICDVFGCFFEFEVFLISLDVYDRWQVHKNFNIQPHANLVALCYTQQLQLQKF